MKISKQHLRLGSKKRTGRRMNPTHITIHGTGNPTSTAQNERDYLTNPSNTNSTGYHYVVGDNVIIEVAPPNEVMYHAGSNAGNTKSIGIEMVETGDRKKVIANALKLTKQLQAKYNIGNNNVVRHFDWNRKNCPKILNYNNWQGWKDFKQSLTGISAKPRQLRKGMQGDDVKKLQRDLIKLGFDDSVVDGHYGNDTVRAVKKYQASVKSEVDGMAGNYTLFNIENSLKQKEVKPMLNTPSDWAKKDWEAEVKLGTFDGTNPKSPLTREQYAVIRQRDRK